MLKAEASLGLASKRGAEEESLLRAAQERLASEQNKAAQLTAKREAFALRLEQQQRAESSLAQEARLVPPEPEPEPEALPGDTGRHSGGPLKYIRKGGERVLDMLHKVRAPWNAPTPAGALGARLSRASVQHALRRPT